MKIHTKPPKRKQAKRKDWREHVANLRQQSKIAKEKGDKAAASYYRGLADGIEQALGEL